MAAGPLHDSPCVREGQDAGRVRRVWCGDDRIETTYRDERVARTLVGGRALDAAHGGCREWVATCRRMTTRAGARAAQLRAYKEVRRCPVSAALDFFWCFCVAVCV